MRLEEFLEQDWAITDNANRELLIDEDGRNSKLIAKQDNCKMCFANTYSRFHNHRSPPCIFPNILIGILSKVKNEFGFRNLRYKGIQKGVVGGYAMMWNV